MNGVTSYFDTAHHHQYLLAGTYTITIRGVMSTIMMGDPNSGRDRLNLIEVNELGDVEWSSLNRAFMNASNLVGVSGGDVSQVTDMSFAFYRVKNANLDIDHWETSNVTTVSGMFYDADGTDPDTSSWDTSKVTNMRDMFYQATSSNPNTSNWDTSSVDDMRGMFYQAVSANPDLSGFNVQSVDTMYNMLRFSNISTVNYSNFLINISTQPLLNGVVLSADSIEYNAAAAGPRQSIIDNYSWSITDGGQE